MSPQTYLRTYRPDSAVLTGQAFDQAVVRVSSGDVVGVVTMELGGPLTPTDVVPFLESRLMDPVEVDLPVPKALRPAAARVLAKRRGRALQQSFEMIGGCSPLRRHVSEQARSLEDRLNARFASALGAEFRTYVAMRHGEPSMATARRRMAEDGVSKVILLPLQPHFSASTGGSSLAYWRAHGPVEAPTTLVAEYATHPKLIRALNERIDEGLQRFDREVRGRVRILFAAHGAAKRHLTRLGDPYCCQVHATVRAVLDARADGRDSSVAFLPTMGSGAELGERVGDAVADAADDGASALLVVPISFLSDRIDTAFDLDVTGRAIAAKEGIRHFEVTNGLNDHPLVIDALAECVATHIEPDVLDAGLGLADATRVPTPSHCPVCNRVPHTRAWHADAPVLASETLPDEDDAQRSAA
ncbi:ferrochelatase [Rubrivirga sp. IMCC45206]|uniref:ferrochelatase n=1 Tax=Rubrivirga sp. IMCC45206 TaxID=3391614 RepID=UPI00398FD06D